MKQLITIAIFSILISCNPSIEVVENGKSLLKIEEFPSVDTTVMIKDYFISYKKEGATVSGLVSSAYDENTVSFESKGDVRIDISQNKFDVTTE